MAKLQAGASAPARKNKKASPVQEGRGEAARKLLLSTKNRAAWSLFSAKLVVGIIFRPHGLPPISANLRSAALTNALRCRRTVSVCVFKRAKGGRFAYFALKLALIRLTPALRHGPDLEIVSNRRTKRRPVIKPSLPTSPRLRWAGRDGTFSAPKRAKQKLWKSDRHLLQNLGAKVKMQTE